MKLNAAAISTTAYLLVSCLSHVVANNDTDYTQSLPSIEILSYSLRVPEQKFVRSPSATTTTNMARQQRRQLRKPKSAKKKSSKKCDPDEDVVLANFEQWKDETGYWIGEYSFYSGDGSPYSSLFWPYPYASYKGFITGNVEGNKYRQRNVFMYPPLDNDACAAWAPGFPNVKGDGECGTNGNAKIFEADQKAIKCDGGNIEGPYQNTYTYTTLIGDDNAVLYQVYLPAGSYNFGFPLELEQDRLLQSQLTTITKSMDGNQVYRTRTAQGFDIMAGTTNSVSYYREKKVSKEEFYNELKTAQSEYNIREEDMCKWDSNNVDILGGSDGSFQHCRSNLEESFDL